MVRLYTGGRTQRVLIVLVGLMLVAAGTALPATSAWPDCGWQCPANDTDVEELWLGDASGSPLLPCSSGTSASAYVWAKLRNGTGTSRYAFRAFGDVTIGGTTTSFEDCILDTLLKKTGSNPTYADVVVYGPFAWTCGIGVSVDLIIAWSTSAHTCADAPVCNDYPAGQCYADDLEIAESLSPSYTIVKSVTDVGGDGASGSVDADGDVISYSVVVTNTGNQTLTGITFSDSLVGTVGNAPTSKSLNADSDIDVGESWTWTYTYTATQADVDAGGTIDNTATVNCTQLDPKTSSKSVSVGTNSGYTIVKSVTDVGGDGASGSVDADGDVISYSVVVTNTGNQTLTGITFSDSLVGTVGNAPTSKSLNADSDIDVGESWTWTYTYTATQADVDAGGTIDNTATVNCTQLDPKTSSKSVSVGENASYSIEKSVTDVDGEGSGGAADEVGDVISYSVVVTNTGNQTLTGITFSDSLVGTVGNTPTSKSLNQDSDIDVGEAWTWLYTYTVIQADITAGGTIDNTATVDCAELEAATSSKGVTVRQPGGISVVKVADPKDGEDFSFNGAFGAFTLDDASPDDLDAYSNQEDLGQHPPGNYQIYEVVPAGWTCQVSVTTNDTADSTSSWLDAGSSRMYVEIDLDENENIQITFTNTRPYCTLRVRKSTSPSGAAGFGFSHDVEDPFTFTLNDGGEEAFIEIDPGTYEIIESSFPAGDWTLTTIQSSGDGIAQFGDGTTVHSEFQTGDDRIVITLAAGEEGIVTFYNEIIQTPSPGGGGAGGGAGGGSFNQAPMPTAGPDRTVCVGELVCLDATWSYDPDDEVPPVPGVTDPEERDTDLVFHWEFDVLYQLNGSPVYKIPEGSHAYSSAEGFDTATPCFIADVAGDYVLNVAVTDRYGATAMDQVTLHAGVCDDRYTCWYPDGWNLFSLPVQAINPTTDTVLSGTSASGPPYAYRYTAGEGYDEAGRLSYSEGFWTHFVTPDSISVLGREIRSDVTLQLENEGWHLISSPFSVEWERMTVFVNGVERFVGEPQARTVIEDFCACFDAEANVYRISDEILPCQGYWVRTNAPDVAIRFEWTQYSASRPVAEGGCSSGPTSTLPPPPLSSIPQTSIGVLAYPNPVRHSTVTFELKGAQDTDVLLLRVFTASGQQVWESEVSDRSVLWEPRTPDGERLPWGPYPYCFYTLVNGKWVRSECGILFIAEVD
ncbi:hypothetical protein ACFLSZ_05035 [Candidatus Bipolaricaulota bacterium]